MVFEFTGICCNLLIGDRGFKLTIDPVRGNPSYDAFVAIVFSIFTAKVFDLDL